MVGVGEMLAAAVVKEVVGKLLAVASAAARGPVKTMWRFKDDLEEMTKTLKFVEAGIRDAERRSVKDEVARLWLKRLKKAAYDISDMFEEFEANSPPRIWSKGKMAFKMKKMNKRLKKISKQRKRYETEIVYIPVYEQDKKAEKRETTSRMGSDVIIGRRHEKEAVINILLSINNKAAATSTVNSPLEISNCALIYGLGGVGKTELAKLVFNDERIREDFPLRAWVYLHQNFEVDDIGRAIICEVEGGVCELKTRQSINRHLEKVLCSRCLVVLDNLWDSPQLTDLEGILGSNVSILVTSRRNWKWAKSRSFHLEPLSEKFSLDLVKQVASSYFLEGDIPEDVMKAIVETCKGVPLAVKTVASLLKPERGGKELLGIINSSFQPESCHGITAEQTVIESLKLTYHCMKPHIKLCFAYCAMFPKGCEINREDLYHQWIALDLIQGSPMIKKMSAAEGNVHELVVMSFLQDSGPPSVIKSSGVPAKLKMHDLGFWLDSPSRSNSYMLPARSLVILWAYDDRYWRWHSVPESRFAESVELLEVWWLVIEGRVPAEALSADTSYDVYLVYKLADEHDGLRWGESSVCVDGEDATRAIVSFVDEDAVRVDGVAYPVTRSEGWMELRLGEFHSKRGDNEVKMIVSEKTDTYSKKGLIIEGMEIRAKSLATS